MIDPDTGKKYEGFLPKDDPNKVEPDSTRSRFYPIWITAPSGETKTVEIQATSLEDARSKAFLHYKTADRILIDIQ